MPTIYIWLFTLLSIAAILYVAEVFIPSHGVLTILATACLVVCVAICFVIDRWLGVGVMAALAVLGPIGISLGVSVWQRTPVGKRMVLTSVAGEAPKPFVLVGSVGTALTELRPMGECEFDGSRIEARSELSRIIAAGQEVSVISLHDGVATVRPVSNSTLEPKEIDS